MRRTSLALLALGLIAVTTAGAVAFRSGGVPPVPAPAPSPATPPVPLGAAQGDPLLAERTKGAATAALTIYEMSDFQCPWCRKQATEVLPVLEREFIATGKVRWIFINFPLTQLHPNAAAAAEFAMCAAKAERFWPVHDLLFTYQDKWAPLKDPAPFLITLADSAGIARDAMLPCLQNHEMQGLIQGEAQGAARSGVQSTPTVYIEGVGLIPGAAPLAAYRQILDSLWKEKSGAKR